jgi:DDB1- and CUL4-associated factor 15
MKVKQDQLAETLSSSVPCYMTVTAIPALNGCQDCIKVAANYEEEELAAAWNSCARLSCLEHGVTVHTSFDLVPPYPR